MIIKKYEKAELKETGEVITAMHDSEGHGTFSYRREDGTQGFLIGDLDAKLKVLKTQPPETRMVGFMISNHLCKYYEDPLGCNRDDEFHTCCIEDCNEQSVVLGSNPLRHMELSKPMWVVDNVCKKEELADDAICNIGYACDGCPYNKREAVTDE